MKYISLSFVIIFLVLSGCSQNVTIDSQKWMPKNLDVSNFRNGDPIPQAKTNAEWKKAGESRQPAWCYYENESVIGNKYGKLYNWYAVNDPRGLAPEGYHIPTRGEWILLTEFLGGEYEAGKKMKTKEGWRDNGNGNNQSGFSGLPGGGRDDQGAFFLLGQGGHWWTSTENEEQAWLYMLSHKVNFVRSDDGSKGVGLSVRCVAN
jgi:uncharacterized protein (TIGR02145 family)